MQLLNMEILLDGNFLTSNSFSSQSWKRTGKDSIVHSAYEDNQSTDERDTVRRLHCSVTVTDHISLCNKKLV
jgi:hypothetical protein